MNRHHWQKSQVTCLQWMSFLFVFFESKHDHDPDLILKYMSYDINTASVLKPNRSKPQWPPEMTSYTTSGVVVGKLMMWSERSQIQLGNWGAGLHWRLSTGPTGHPEHTLCSHSQYSLLLGKTHMWIMTLSHATSSSLYQMISFRLSSSEHPARTESVPEDDNPKPFWGFRIFSTSYHLHLKFFSSNLHQTLLISGNFFFLSKYLQIKYSVGNISVK